MTAPLTSGPTLEELAAELESGRITSRSLVEKCLSRIDDPAGEGSKAFIAVAAAKALALADAFDALRANGAAPSRFAGIPISVKDLFDLAGEVTRAGSVVLANAPAAAADAEAVRLLKRAGFIVIGRTNMSEFAFSGLGLNPHYGTPRGVWDRKTGRVPGGSSSGAAVSVVDGMAHAGLGTDTGGSCRIPAAFNGIVGFKPTASRVSKAGAVPLSQTLDSVGPLARSVSCCMVLDDILAGGEPSRPEPVRDVRGLRVFAPSNYFLDGADSAVTFAFRHALTILIKAGAQVSEGEFDELGEIPTINRKGGFPAAESYAWHSELIARSPEAYDPLVITRIKRGLEQTAADYVRLKAERENFVDRVAKRLAAFDVVAFPTTPIVPPGIAECATPDDFGRFNILCLRNSTAVNMWDGCAISLPIKTLDGTPVGLTLASTGGRDKELLKWAAAVEQVFARS